MFRGIQKLLLRVLSLAAIATGTVSIFFCVLTIAAVEADIHWFDAMYCRAAYMSFLEHTPGFFSETPSPPEILFDSGVASAELATSYTVEYELANADIFTFTDGENSFAFMPIDEVRYALRGRIIPFEHGN